MDNRYKSYGLYYLYRHIRLDKNEPFYIGIGKKAGRYGSYEVEYRRAFTVHNRNKAWRNVVAKTPYSVEILFESNSEEFIREKEKEFIKLYGRKDINTGPLYNWTDGGEGMLNMSQALKENIGRIHKNKVISLETKLKISETLKGRRDRISDSGKGKLSQLLSERKSKPVFQYTLEGTLLKVWNSAQEASLSLGLSRTTVSKFCTSNTHKGQNFLWYYKINLDEYSRENTIAGERATIIKD